MQYNVAKCQMLLMATVLVIYKPYLVLETLVINYLRLILMCPFVHFANL